MTEVSWLWVSLWGRLPTPLLEIALAFFAILCGAFLGDERQRRVRDRCDKLHSGLGYLL